MRGKGTVKVPDGKRVVVEASVDEVFENVKITGDFFLQPPDALEDIEDALNGVSSEASRESIVSELEGVDAEMIGFSPEHLAEALLEVDEKCSGE